MKTASPGRRNRGNPDVVRGILRSRRQWNIGVVRAPVHRFLEADFHPAVEWLPPPRRAEGFADPFGMVRDRCLRVMCERFDRRTGSGSIWTVDWPADGSWSRSTPVLRLKGPACYPYLFEHRGQIYCVPETSRAGEVRLYRADPFPLAWISSGTLLRGFPAVHNTLFSYDGRWWLACTSAQAPDRKLFLWYADDLDGPWSPHPRNPVKDDPGSATPAGPPFVWQGTLYRPAQDRSPGHAARIVLNAVEELTPDRFRETPRGVVEPDAEGPYPLGIRTLSAAGAVTLVDGMREGWPTWRGRRRTGRASRA